MVSVVSSGQESGFPSPVVLTGLLKWFSEEKGHGFIIPGTGEPDVIIHLGVLKAGGYAVPLEGTTITFRAQQRKKGMQCLEVIAVDASTAIELQKPRHRPPTEVKSASGWEKAKVKWFNRLRGFGFLIIEQTDVGDIFVHMDLLSKSGFESGLVEDQTVLVKYGKGEKGLMAVEVKALES